MKHFQSFQTFSEKTRVANEQRKLQEKEGQQKEYADFFMKLLKKYDVTSPDQLDDEKKKQFFDDVAKGWSKDSGVTSAGKELVGEDKTEQNNQQ